MTSGLGAMRLGRLFALLQKIDLLLHWKITKFRDIGADDLKRAVACDYVGEALPRSEHRP